MRNTFLIVCFTITLCYPFAQKNVLDDFVVKPTQCSKYTMIGMVGPYVEYTTPKLEKEVPVEFNKLKDIDFNLSLNLGIESLLLNYKQYSRDQPKYYYILQGFAYLMKESIEDYIKDKDMLNKMYDWYVPEAKKTFKLLTYEEQLYHINKILLCEAYINLVKIKNDEASYEKFLASKNMYEDRWIQGFINRRINNEQWTIEDCLFWVNKIKKDFMPLIKNPRQRKNHYNVYDTIGKYYLALKANGKTVLLDKNYQLLTDKEVYATEKINDSLLVVFLDKYFTFDLYINELSGKNEVWNINEIARTGKVIPQKHIPNRVRFRTKEDIKIEVSSRYDDIDTISLAEIDTIYTIELMETYYKKFSDEDYQAHHEILSVYSARKPEFKDFFIVELIDTIFLDKEIEKEIIDEETYESKIVKVNYNLEYNYLYSEFDIHSDADYPGRAIRVSRQRYLDFYEQNSIHPFNIAEKIVNNRKKYGDIKIVTVKVWR
jgi:hypothetical protein